MMGKNGMLAMVTVMASVIAVSASESSSSFIWGAASAAYQHEGHVSADNRGWTIWDKYLSEESLAGPGISGATSVNMYDPAQYKQDIARMKQLGLTSYRFSVSWSRIMPDGLGPVNMAGIKHYRDFIVELKEAGIKPMMTLYHFDLPVSLSLAGGWSRRESVDWFQRYAEVVFDHFHDIVDLYALINQPTTELLISKQAEKLRAGESEESVHGFPVGSEDLEDSLRAYNHILLAAAAAKEVFDAKKYSGSIGLALEVTPVITSADATSQDLKMAKLVDGITLRWFLDSTVYGTYPQDILDLCSELRIDPGIKDEDAARIGKAKLDYIGANFYVPTYIRAARDNNKDGSSSSSNSPYAPETYTPEGVETMLLGPVQPETFKDVLLRIKSEYKNTPVIITENGASFQKDDILVNGKVFDKKRCRYIVNHIRAMEEARAEGADIRGYYMWSNVDNLEWFNGYNTRFGLSYVDFDSQERTPKLTSSIYRSIIAGHEVTASSCDVDSYHIGEKKMSFKGLLNYFQLMFFHE